MKFFIDLFAGLCGASSGFFDRPGWTVIAIDNNPELLELAPHVLMCDISNTTATIALIERELEQYGFNPNVDELVIWASPPCMEFSFGFNAPGPTAQRAGEDFQPDLSLMMAADEIIQHFCPKWWFVENVRGAITHFTPHLGQFRQQLGSFFLWGRFPYIHHPRMTINKTDHDRRWHPLRANFRAQVPTVFSSAIRESLDKQKTLF